VCFHIVVSAYRDARSAVGTSAGLEHGAIEVVNVGLGREFDDAGAYAGSAHPLLDVLHEEVRDWVRPAALEEPRGESPDARAHDDVEVHLPPDLANHLHIA